MMIDCGSCEMRGKECGDCVVSFLTIEVRPTDRGTVELDHDQATAVAALAEAGLVPPLRLVEARGAQPARRDRRAG